MAHQSEASALRELHRARRERRRRNIDWWDVLYQTYVTAILGGVGLTILTSRFGGPPLPEATVSDIIEHGPGVVGGIAAVLVAGGLRSGSRGGPLVLEPAEVRHVLLAPVPRAVALRRPTVKLLRRWLFVGCAFGTVAGLLAHPRLGSSLPQWLVAGALVGTTLAAITCGAALIGSGARMSRALAAGVGALLIGDAGAEIALDLKGPFTTLGGMAFAPLLSTQAWRRVLIPVVASVGVGVAMLGGSSIEAARRRASLVGQLKFAATLFDVRTIILLRRHLSLETPRPRPWLDASRVARSLPVVQRDIASLMRWPAARLFKLIALGCIAGFLLLLFWNGSTLLIAVAGGVLFLAALDAVEPAAQEIDQRPLRQALPLSDVQLARRHAGVSIAVMLAPSAVAMATVAMFAGTPPPPAVLLASAPAVSVTAVRGAMRNVRREAPALAAVKSAPSVDLYGQYVAVDLATSPLIACLGLLPLLVARL